MAKQDIINEIGNIMGECNLIKKQYDQVIKETDNFEKESIKMHNETRRQGLDYLMRLVNILVNSHANIRQKALNIDDMAKRIKRKLDEKE